MTDFDHHYKIQKNAGFRLGHSLISAFFCDLWILLFVQPIVNNRYIDLSDLSYTAPMWLILNFHCTGARLKNHSRNLYAPLCGIFCRDFFLTHSGIPKHFQKALVKIYEIAVKKMRKKCK